MWGLRAEIRILMHELHESFLLVILICLVWLINKETLFHEFVAQIVGTFD